MRRLKTRIVCVAVALGCGLSPLAAPRAHAQSATLTLDGFGQTYYPAGLLNLETRVRSYPWVTGEAQVWVGQSPSSASDDGQFGDVLVLAVDVREPTGHAHLRAGRFVLATGAVRPVHVDGGYTRLRIGGGFALEAFGGAPVLPRFQARSFDWLAGGRVSQRVSDSAVLGASYVHRREYGELSDEEVGVDLLLMPSRRFDLAGRASYDLVGKGLSEAQATVSSGTSDDRLEVFGQYRDPSLILPATSLFSVLGDASTVAAGVSGRTRLYPRLSVFGEASYRNVAHGHGGAGALGSRLWLDAEGVSFIEGELSHQQVDAAQWTALRTVYAREIRHAWRLGGEVEVAVPARDDTRGGRVWPWARLWARWQISEAWLLAAAFEGSSSPQFTRLFSGMLRLSFHSQVSS